MDSSARSQKARLDYDVVVVGGCYSAPATAMLLARAGIRVGLVDRPVGEIDALLAHALLRAGVIQRHRWGLLDQVIAAAITAHGISDALRDAELLAVATTAFLGGELTEAAAMAEYHRTRDRLSRATVRGDRHLRLLPVGHRARSRPTCAPSARPWSTRSTTSWPAASGARAARPE